MLWLTNAALKYAVDVCVEEPDYTVTVYADSIGEYDDILQKLSSFVKNKGATVHDILNWHVVFNNDSRINVLRTGLIPNGQHPNLAIVSHGIDHDMIRNIMAGEINRAPDGMQLAPEDAYINGLFIGGEEGEERVVATNNHMHDIADIVERLDEMRRRVYGL